MTEYISKSTLLAEIERLVNNYDKALDYEAALEDVRNFIDSLEVKEVDLDAELNKWRHNHFHGRRDKEASGEYLERVSQLELAKHFFELGLKARTDKELVEEIYSHIDSIKDTADRMTSGNFMHNKAAIKFSANTIAKVLELIGLKTQKGE